MDWLQALINAGLPCTAAWVDERERVQASFTRELTRAEWLTFLSLTDPVRARREGAREEARLAEALRTCTPQQAVDYIEANVTNLASAKAALKLMVRVLVAMRDEVWPEMADEQTVK